MGLCVQHARNGEEIKYHYGYFHLFSILSVARSQHMSGRLKRLGEVRLKKGAVRTDPADGEVMKFQRGDVLRLWRD